MAPRFLFLVAAFAAIQSEHGQALAQCEGSSNYAACMTSYKRASASAANSASSLASAQSSFDAMTSSYNSAYSSASEAGYPMHSVDFGPGPSALASQSASWASQPSANQAVQVALSNAALTAVTLMTIAQTVASLLQVTTAATVSTLLDGSLTTIPAIYTTASSIPNSSQSTAVSNGALRPKTMFVGDSDISGTMMVYQTAKLPKKAWIGVGVGFGVAVTALLVALFFLR